MLWTLAGKAGGAKVKKGNRSGTQRGSQVSGSLHGGSSVFGASKKGKSKSKSRSRLGESISEVGTIKTGATSKRPVRQTRLAELVLADNQLGEEIGPALGHYIKSSGTLTALDISKNSLGVTGGKHLAQFLSDAYGHNARILEKKMDEEEKALKHKRRERLREEFRMKKREDGYSNLDDGMSDYDGSETTVDEEDEFPDHWKKKISLLHLDVSRNGLGPINVQMMMDAIAMPNCTITSLDISDNPLGVSSERAGKSVICASAIRKGIMKNCTLKRIKLNNLSLSPPQVLPLLGGISNSRSLIEIQVNDMLFDEPCCLQLANGIGACLTLEKIVVRNCVMGPKGGGLVAVNIERVACNLRYLDMTGNRIGFCAMEPVLRALSKDSCRISTLLLADNELDEEGGMRVVHALKVNPVITELDLSRNYLTPKVAQELAEVTKEYIIGGVIVTNCRIRKILLNDNPDIGNRGARVLVNAFSNEWTEHVEMSNVGASQSAAHEVSLSLRKVTVAWKHMDLTHNDFSRVGLNQIFWSLRQNRRLRVLRLGHNKGGLKLGASTDTLGRYGVGLTRALQENLVVRELDLSYLGLSSDAGTNIFTAIQNNFTIRVLKVRGNCFDDSCSVALENMLKENDIITELDIGANKFGSNFAYSLADGLLENRSLQTLISDNNNLAIAGASTLESFYNAILYNHSLRRLDLDSNRMGTAWGLRIAEGLSKNSTIMQISLRNNRLDSRVGEALLMTYSHNTTLQELAVSSEEVGMDVFGRIKTVFLKKRQVSHEDLVELQTTMETNMDNVAGRLYG
jgi:Ran GTPase-activating protein (RanGAP) involved in mRNA processing and transport